MISEHHHHYNREKFHFNWGTIDHPGIWACGGGRKDLPPVCVGVTAQIPHPDKQEAWWAYIGPLPEFDNDWNALNAKDRGEYLDQSTTTFDPEKFTRNKP